MYIKKYDHYDLLEDLMKRTQARGETIINYLTVIKYLISRFKEPPTDDEITRIVYRNLLPNFRRSMRREHIRTREDISLMFDKENDTDKRYAPPPTAEKCTCRLVRLQHRERLLLLKSSLRVQWPQAVLPQQRLTKRGRRKLGEARKTKW